MVLSVFRNRIRIGSGFKWVSGSGSRQAWIVPEKEMRSSCMHLTYNMVLAYFYQCFVFGLDPDSNGSADPDPDMPELSQKRKCEVHVCILLTLGYSRIFISVSYSDPDWIRIQMGQRIRIQTGLNCPRKGNAKFMYASYLQYGTRVFLSVFRNWIRIQMGQGIRIQTGQNCFRKGKTKNHVY